MALCKTESQLCAFAPWKDMNKSPQTTIKALFMIRQIVNFREQR